MPAPLPNSAAMDALAKDLYDRALENREKRTYSATTMDEIKQIDNDVHEAEEAPQIKMTLGSRLSPDALAKLKALRGR